jgi:hypothetical protein
MKRLHTLKRHVIAAFVALSFTVAAPANAQPTDACVNATQALNKMERYSSKGIVRKLAKLHGEDPTCGMAADTAYRKLHYVWSRILPRPATKVSKRRIKADWKGFKTHARVLEHVLKFPEIKLRLRAGLSLAHLYHRMSEYLVGAGSSLDRTVTPRRTAASLYNSRTMRLSEQMRQKAARNYKLVITLHGDAQLGKQVADEARLGLETLKGTR